MEQLIVLPSRVQLTAFALMAIPRVLAAFFVLVLFWLALKLTRPALRGALNRAHFAPALVHLLVDGLYKGVVVVLAAVMAASQVGINVGAALAGIGVVGIAVGFAAQETIANMILGPTPTPCQGYKLNNCQHQRKPKSVVAGEWPASSQAAGGWRKAERRAPLPPWPWTLVIS